MRLQSSPLQRLQLPADRRWLRARLPPLTSASFFLAMAPAPTPRRCIPPWARGPPRCRDPGCALPGTRRPLPNAEARSLRHLRAPEAARRLPSAGRRQPRAWSRALLCLGGRVRAAGGGGEGTVSGYRPRPSWCGPAFLTHVDVSDSLVFPWLPLHPHPRHQAHWPPTWFLDNEGSI